MKKTVFAFFVIVFALALTCTSTENRNDSGHIEWIAQLAEKQEKQSLRKTINNQDINAQLMDDQPVFGFRLPAGLTVIEDEAFEGIAIETVELPENVEYVGNRAFANISSLRIVKIPEKTRVIAKTAFDGSANVTITGAPGSYARAFARENGIPFVPVMVMYAGSGKAQHLVLSEARWIQTDHPFSANETLLEARWRPVSEIKAEKYDLFIANHIIGRAPPFACV